MAATGRDDSTARGRRFFFIITGAAVLATIVGVALLMNIFERKQEARNPFYRVVELTDDTEDPAVWGKNFPLQYDDYKRTVDQVRTRFGGSEALPRTPTRADPRSVVSQSKVEEDPRLKVMWAGYAFAQDFRENAATPTCSTTRSSPNANKSSNSPARAFNAMHRSTYPT
jgi:nitrite reductase (cytochrome c-552)